MCADACLLSVSNSIVVCFGLVDSLCTGRSLCVARLFIICMLLRALLGRGFSEACCESALMQLQQAHIGCVLQIAKRCC